MAEKEGRWIRCLQRAWRNFSNSCINTLSELTENLVKSSSRFLIHPTLARTSYFSNLIWHKLLPEYSVYWFLDRNIFTFQYVFAIILLSCFFFFFYQNGNASETHLFSHSEDKSKIHKCSLRISNKAVEALLNNIHNSISNLFSCSLSIEALSCFKIKHSRICFLFFWHTSQCLKRFYFYPPPSVFKTKSYQFCMFFSYLTSLPLHPFPALVLKQQIRHMNYEWRSK